MHPTERDVDQARQGETGHGVRFVLAASLVLALLAMLLVLSFAR
jgi:hypothetical protein